MFSWRGGGGVEYEGRVNGAVRYDFFFEQWTFFHGALRPQKPQGLLGTGFVVVYLDYKYSALITYLIRPFIGQWSVFLPDASCTPSRYMRAVFLDCRPLTFQQVYSHFLVGSYTHY